MASDAVRLSGRRALVTGGASGIGLAVVTRLAELGAEVVIADVATEKLDAVAAETRGAIAVTADLSRADEVDRLAHAAGEIDILVNNAGLQHVSPIEDFPEDRWQLIHAVMLTAPFLLIKRLLPGMYARQWGRVINIASVHGLVASPYKAAYVAAKHGLVGLTKTVALEAGEHPGEVSAHAICPSYVRTALVEGQVADQARAHGISPDQVLEQVMLTRNAVKRLIEPADVARAVEFLCGDIGWTMTGSVLSMDAGWLAH